MMLHLSIELLAAYLKNSHYCNSASTAATHNLFLTPTGGAKMLVCCVDTNHMIQ